MAQGMEKLDSGSHLKRNIILGVGTAAVGLWLLTSVGKVDAGEVGIVTSGGHINRTVDSGWVIKAPWPFEDLTKMNTRVQMVKQESKAATKDTQDANATLALTYRVDRDSALYVFKELGPDYEENIIIPALQESFKDASAKYDATQLITDRTAVKKRSLDVIKANTEKFKIKTVDLNVTNFAFSDPYTRAIENKQVAAQEVQTAQFKFDKAKLDAQSQEVQKQSLSPELLQKMAIDKWKGDVPQYLGSGTIFNIPLGTTPK